MGVFVAPGVYTREVDLSLYVPALSTTIVGMVGRSIKGPTNERTYVTNQQQFIDIFGEPDSTIGYETYSALQYLRRGRQLWFVRVVGDSAAASTGTFQRATPVSSAEEMDNSPDGAETSFSGTLANFPVEPGTLTVEATVGAATVEIVDDGLGGLSGNNVTGTITYSTGDWTLAFTVTPPDNATTIDATAYSYHQDGVVFSAVSEGEWGNKISVKVEAGTNSGSRKLTIYYDDIAKERFDNVVLDDSSTDYIETRLNGVSDFITAAVDVGVGAGSSEPLALVSTPSALTGGDTDAGNVSATEVIGQAWNASLAKPTGLYQLASPGAVDVNLLAAPGWYDAAVVNELIQVAETRGDCLAIIDPPSGLTPQEVVDWHNGEGSYAGQHAAFNSSYAACYWPWVKVYDAYNGQYVFTPPSGHALAVYAYTDQTTESWFAPAGLQRGRVISGVDTAYNPSQGEVELLYGDGNAINPIENFHQDGLVIWGQRTLQRAPTALDRVNVRRLLLYLRKVITTATRFLVFEPNDEKTWRLFGHLVTPFMNDVKQRRGVYDFRVKCDETTNTPEVIDRNEMHAQIFLKPVKAAEFIQVDLVITRTGANFDEVLY